jgi:5-deoxy-glucuronate isomerase
MTDIPVAQGKLEYVSFSAYEAGKGKIISLNTGNNECGVVILKGICDIQAPAKEWLAIGERMSIFSETPPYVMYLPHDTNFKIVALTDLHFAVAMTPSEKNLEPRLVTPQEIPRIKRGSGNRVRYVNRINAIGVDTKLIFFEVYSPEGNWSSYPPHKHDEEIPPKESLLQEFYYYQFNPEKGFALQWNFSDDLSLNEAAMVRNHSLVAVPRGYHTVVTAPGYEGYYLNAMAGPTVNWNFTVHPDHKHLQDY